VVDDAAVRVYVDASALVKLVITEAESASLRRFLSKDPLLVSSRIAAVEVRRVAARQDEVGTEAQVEALLGAVHFVEMDEAMALAAGTAPPPSLGSLDAIHLAAAQLVASEVTAVVIYDRRLADAAQGAGLTVIAPSSTRLN